MVKDRLQEMKSLTKEPKKIVSRLALLCAPPSPARIAKEQGNPHLNRFVKVYVTPAGEAAATGHESTHPQGTVLVKEKLPAVTDPKTKKESAGAAPELFTGMLKREAGFNPAAGDWEFFTVSGNAAKITSRGKLESCIDCHKDYTRSDCVSPEYRERPVLKPEADGSLLLHSKDAVVSGKMLRYEPRPEKNTLGYWTKKEDTAEWTLAPKEGTYEVEVLQGCGTGSGGAQVEVRIGDQILKFTVEDTGHFQNFKPRVIGRVSLKSSTYSLEVVPVTKPGAAVMDLRSITLRPVAK
jgi:hypothetical protein